MHLMILAVVPSLVETLLAILVIVIGWVGWLMRENISSNKGRVETLDARQSTIEADVKELRDTKADKEDLLRETGRVSLKLDALFTKLDQHEGSDNALRDLAIEMAKAVRREQ